MPTSSVNPATEKRDRWHLLYYALAGFDLLTIVASLGMNYSLLGFFGQTVTVHDDWMRREDTYERLSEAAADLDRPGNDIFDTRDPVNEAHRMNEFSANFRTILTEIRDDTATIAMKPDRQRIEDDLNAIESGMRTMVDTSSLIFAKFGKGSPLAAERHMAQIDRDYSALNISLSALRRHADEIERVELRERQGRANVYARFEYIFAATVLLIVGLALVYGRAMSRRFLEANRTIEAQRATVVSASRLSALGEMAGGIAHEINNPLAIIHAKASLMREDVETGDFDAPSIIAAATVIENTAMRIAKIIKGLRSFARDGRDDPMRAESARKIVEETLDFCRSKLKRDRIELIIELPDQDPLFDCRSTEISQVLMNLLSNADDAVRRRDEKWIRLTVIDQGTEVEFAVEDSGPGIPCELREKIMQPFFTTKEVGAGTGLGLSISTGIAQAHGGRLFVDPHSTHTRFVLRIPKERRPGLLIPSGDSGLPKSPDASARGAA